MQEMGDFSDSFIGNIDRLIKTMHPKYKKEPEKVVVDKEAVRDEKVHKFPGLAIPNNPGWVSIGLYSLLFENIFFLSFPLKKKKKKFKISKMSFFYTIARRR
jgi:hypothetical protein